MEKILVLAGGRGSERDVSIASGKRVAESFCGLGLKTALIDPISDVSASKEHFFSNFNELKKASSLFSSSGCADLADNTSSAKIISEKSSASFCVSNLQSDSPLASPFPDKDTRSDVKFGSQKEIFITESVLRLCKTADAVFIMLHGGIGENGRLQALFECLGIKYFGSSPEGSAAAMDKLHAKRIFESVGIPTPLYTVYRGGQNSPPIPPRFPCVVKPVSEGSSVGVTLVKTPGELKVAVDAALKNCDTVLMEAEIRGREITVGVLEDRALAVTEIIPNDGFYDYESKYTAGKTLEITPAEIPEALTKRALRLAARAHRALGLSNFSRVDMMIEDKTNLIYVLEVNTIPGMTKTSLLPLAAEYSGIGFTELCGRMAK